MQWTRLTVALALALLAQGASAQEFEKAVFAGGCFWCVESDFDKVPGVVSTVSGYTGGATENPTYPQVTAGGTGHYEAVEITYDPAKVSYDALLTAFWHSVDPTDDGGQFCDRGHSYKTAVFANEEQRQLAEDSRQTAQQTLDQPIVEAADIRPVAVGAARHLQVERQGLARIEARSLGQERIEAANQEAGSE